MERRTLKFCRATSAALVLLSCGHALASDDTPPAPGATGSSHLSAKPHARPAARSRKAAQAAKVEDKKAAAAKAQPWFDVDPGRAAVPPDPAAADAKPAAPAAKWAKDRFDFDSKVTGSNDFHVLPRFDANENPQGLGGQMGVNLHF